MGNHIHALGYVDYPRENEDVEPLLAPGTFDTPEICPICGHNLLMTEELFSLEMRLAWVEEDEGIVSSPLFHPDGTPVFNSYLFHFDCWEESVEFLQELIEDVPPLVSPHQLLVCTECGGSIEEYEAFCQIVFGELHASKRSPSGASSSTFQDIGKPLAMCQACCYRLLDHGLEEWEDELVARIPELNIVGDYNP